MKKTTKTALVAAGVTVGVVGFGLLYQYTAKKLMKLALDREAPPEIKKGREKLIGSSPVPDLEESLRRGAEDLLERDFERVSIMATDGVELVGHWYECPTPKRVIVAMHGWRSNWAYDFGHIAKFWFQHDCSVLFVEQRGQGSSGGEYIGFGLTERHDCPEWIQYVIRRCGDQVPVYLAGISMGATTVLMASADGLPMSVKGIIADCAFTSPRAIWKHVMENNFHLPYGIYRTVAEDLYEKKLRVSSDSYSTVDALSRTRIPVLFIHGTEDHFVPPEMTYENYKACASPKRLFVVPGADHGTSYLVDPAGYEREVLSFFEQYDHQ